MRQVKLEGTSFQGVTLTQGPGTPGYCDLDKIASKVIDTVKLCLEKRYEDLDQTVIKATKIADLTTWPAEYDESMC